MEDFPNRWAKTRLEREPDWVDTAGKELKKGLVSFQALLEFHAGFFEAWYICKYCNIFAVTFSDLLLIVPHQASLNLGHKS
jgi:hypothetical protein